MNPARQFWALFKFQLTANPYIWIYLFALGMPFLIIPSHDDLMSLHQIAPTQNLFFIGFLGVLLLAPEIFYMSSTGQWAAYGSEFLLTRAVDRNLLARSKAVALYLVALIVPALMFLFSLRDPGLRFTSYTKNEQQACLAHIPGSSLLKDKYGHADLISISWGNILIAAWHVWEILLAALAVQLIITLIQPLRYRKYIFFGFLAIFGLAPLAGLMLHFVSPSEQIFLFFTGNQPLAWIGAILLFVLTQRFWERRFAQFEP